MQCSQCHNQFDIDTDIIQTALVCHRCSHEFNPSSQTDSDQSGDHQPRFRHCSERVFPAPPFLARNTAPQTAADRPDNGLEGALADMPPQRKKAHVWPWLLAMLMTTITAGFWIQQEQWLDNRWLRSTMINLNIPMQQRDKDWLIIPESVHPEWVTRNDGSKVLVIRGKLSNLLACDLMAPDVEITFYALNQPDQVLDVRQRPISMRPDEHAIKQVPFIRTQADSMPVGPLSSREFIFVMETLPAGSGDFTLTPRVR